LGLATPHVTSKGDAQIISGRAGAVLIASAGLLASGVWFLLLRSFRDLNRAKFKVLHEIEESLPVAIFTREWELVKPHSPIPWWRPPRRSAEFGVVEHAVPILFALLYGAALGLIVAS